MPELKTLAKLMKMEATHEEIEELVRSEGGDDMQISFDEFVASLTRVPQVDYESKDVLKAFKMLGGQRQPKGRILMTDLMHTFCTYEDGMSDAQATELLGKVEVKKDGYFNYAEYVNLMMAGPSGLSNGSTISKKSPKKS